MISINIPVRKDSRWAWAIIIAAGLVFGLKIAIALNTYGSNDVRIKEAHVAKVRAEGVLAWYRDGIRVYGPDGRLLIFAVANHPPMGLHLFQACGFLSGRTGLPLGFWLRLACSVADVASLLLLGKILKRSGSP